MRYKIVLEYFGSNYIGSQKQPSGPTIQEKLEKAVSTLTKENTKVTDKDGNTITIPEGFTPQPNPDADPGSDPNGYYDPEIEDGVIVKDTNGNEFVWIPVGTINTDNGQRTIEYNRYAYSNWVGTETDEETGSTKIKTTADQTEYFAESLNESEKNSAVSNGGFYLGRYEAGVSGGSARTEDSGTSQTVEIKPNLDVYNLCNTK